MKVTQKAELDALHRIQVFMNQNSDALGAVNQSQSRTALDQAVTALEATTATQQAAQVGATSATVQKESLRETLRLQHMQPIAAIARTQLAGTPSIVKLRLPQKKINDTDLIGAGTAMANTAAQYSTVFTNEKLPTDFVAQLQGAVTAVQTAVATRNASTLQLRTATQGVEDQITQARSTVRILNSLVVKQLAGKTDLLAAWQMAKQINAKPGVPRGTKRVAKSTGTPTPAAPVSAAAVAAPAAGSSPSTSAGTSAEPPVAKAA